MKYERLVDSIVDYLYEEAEDPTLPEVLGIKVIVKLQVTHDIEAALDQEEAE